MVVHVVEELLIVRKISHGEHLPKG